MRDYPSTSKDQDQFDLLLATTHIGLWELDVRTDVALRNLRHDNIFGYPKLLDKWSAEIFLDHVVEHDRGRVKGLLEDAVASHSSWMFETQIRAADGVKKWISANGTPKFGDDGEMQKLVGHVIDITETKESEERQRLLARELNHRVKNNLAVVRSIARMTLDRSDEQTDAFLERLQAMSRIHDILQANEWSGIDLRQIVETVLQGGDSANVRVTPPESPVRIGPNAAVTFSMAVHELFTNSLKYGSLRLSDGAVDVDWNISDISKEFVFTWNERNGTSPSQDRMPGFGETILKTALASEIDGVVDMDFAPTGLIVTARGRITDARRG